MMSFKKTFSVLVLLTFLVSSAGFADAKGASSFSGSSGSRSSSPSSSGFSKSSPSVSGFSKPSSSPSSSSTGIKPPTSSSAPAVTGSTGSGSSSWFGLGGGNKAPAATAPSKPAESTNLAGPVASPMSKPPASQTGTFSTSNGASAGEKKTGSAFGGQDATPAKQSGVSPGVYSPRSYTPPTPRYNAREYTNYNPSTKTIIIKQYPADYRPRYYGSTYVYNSNPGFLTLWWQMEMLESIHDRHERDALMRQMQANPEYGKWRDEANKLAGENAALKAQLNNVDHPDEVPLAAPAKKSSHWFLWTLLIIGLCVGGYLLFRRK